MTNQGAMPAYPAVGSRVKATAGQPPFFDKGHVGTVVRNCTDGTTLVHFDDGQGVLFSKVDNGPRWYAEAKELEALSDQPTRQEE